MCSGLDIKMGKGVMCRWGIYGEVSQKEKDKYHMMSLTRGIKYTAQMNLQNRNRLTRRKGMWLPRGEGRGREFGVSRYRLLYMERVSNKVLYSTELYSISSGKP